MHTDTDWFLLPIFSYRKLQNENKKIILAN